VPHEQIVRCSDGHLYTAHWPPFVSLRTVRLGGGARLAKCPIDNRWRVTKIVNANELSESDLQEARSHVSTRW
jgi:hypothetical protein